MSENTGISAYERIYQAIATGLIKPGDRLRETQLAQELGLSRTPIREAIRRLESDGLVDHRPRVGAVLKTLSQQEIVELYEMRVVIEAAAARLAARHISEAELRALSKINQQIAGSKGGGVTADLNKSFHRCILNAARNRYLVQCFEALSHNFILLGATTIETADRIAEVAQQHETIIAALHRRDPDQSEALMSDHMNTSLDYRLKGLHL